MTKPPLFPAGSKVEYIGWDKELSGQLFKVESAPLYRPTYDPPGYYYDLTHRNLKQVPECDIVMA